MFDPVIIALVFAAFLACAFGVALFWRVNKEEIQRRKDMREVAKVAREYGFELGADIADAYADQDAFKFWYDLARLVKLLTGPRERLLAELAGVFLRAAQHSDGLKAMQAAITSVAKSAAQNTVVESLGQAKPA